MNFPHILANGAGNYVDHNKYMDNFLWVFAMMKGNQLSGGGFETWSNGTSFSNPSDGAVLSDSWTLEKGGTTGATCNITREATVKDSGSYSMKADVTVAGSSDSYLKIKQVVSDYSRFFGLTLSLGVKIKVGTASKVRLSLSDGVSTAYSDYHSGSGSWELLVVSLACSTSMTSLTLKVEILSDVVDAFYFDSAFLYITNVLMSTTALQALEYFNPDERESFSTAVIDLIPQATEPTPVVGRIYLNSVDGQVYSCKDGSTWSILG